MGLKQQKAVNHFIRWAKDLNDTVTKSKFYPQVDKKDLFKLNYIASKSSHSRRSIFDLSILDEKGELLDMGSHFDYFGHISWPDYDGISSEQNRRHSLFPLQMLAVNASSLQTRTRQYINDKNSKNHPKG